MSKDFYVAYLIMCHKNPNQVNRLISKLQSDQSICFVHVDSCADFGPESIRGVLTEKRYHGVLGSYSLVQISDELMQCAKAYEKENSIHFRYFCLVSGQDYPLNSIVSIQDELQKNYPTPYIDCTPCARGNWVYNGSKHSAWWNVINIKINQWLPKPGIIRKLVKSPVLVADLITRNWMNPRTMLSKNHIDLYGGSAWWILSDVMVDHLIDAARNFTQNNKFYPLTGVGVPEENYYQTMLMNSEFKNLIRVNPPEMVAQNCKTYANFSPEGKPFTGHPYILTMEDAARLTKLAKNRFFARKFDETVDSSVFDWIDENLLCNKNK